MRIDKSGDRKSSGWRLLVCSVLVLCAPVGAQETGSDKADPAGQAAQPRPPAEPPPRFVSKETIPPDSVISFPADI